MMFRWICPENIREAANTASFKAVSPVAVSPATARKAAARVAVMGATTSGVLEKATTPTDTSSPARWRNCRAAATAAAKGGPCMLPLASMTSTTPIWPPAAVSGRTAGAGTSRPFSVSEKLSVGTSVALSVDTVTVRTGKASVFTSLIWRPDSAS
jgi:hypothetical protein